MGFEEARIKFKKKVTSAQYESDSQLKLSFSNGLLEFSWLIVHNAKCTKLKNLMAFEQCYKDISWQFTKHCFFMDFLIDFDSDVTILQRYEILQSLLGSNSKIAEIFNTLTKEVI